MLELLRQRMEANPRDREIQVAAEQQRQITAIRLDKLLEYVVLGWHVQVTRFI